VNDSVQDAEDDGGWNTGELYSGWRNANTQLLHHRNNFFFNLVVTSVTGSFTCALYLLL